VKSDDLVFEEFLPADLRALDPRRLAPDRPLPARDHREKYWLGRGGRGDRLKSLGGDHPEAGCDTEKRLRTG
jgi:hypothetical protein